MNENQYSIFDPKNPVFLSFARWLVIIISGIAILIGLYGLVYGTPEGLLLMIAAVINYFTGMVFVNMLYNIRDIKINTQKTAFLLEEHLKSNPTDSLKD